MKEEEKQSNQLEAKIPKFLFFRFLFQIVKGALHGIKKGWKLQLLKFILIFLAVLVIHTYLIVVVNEGFSPNLKNPFHTIMVLENHQVNTFFTATFFWMSVVTLIFTLFSRIRATGFKRFFQDLYQTPSWLRKSMKQAGGEWIISLLIGAILALGISFLVSNNFTLGVMALFVLFSVTARNRSGFITFFTFLIMDWRVLWKLEKKKQFLLIGPLVLTTFGLFLGLLLAVFLPFKPISSGVLIVILAIIILFIKRKVIKTNTAMMVLAFVLFNLLFLDMNSVLADDGGWKEGGGNLKDWVESPGAEEAVEKGAATSVFSSIWGILVSIGSGVLQNFLPGSPTVAGPGAFDIFGYLKGIFSADSPYEANRAAAEGLGGFFIPGLSDFIDQGVGSMLDFPNSDPASTGGGGSASGGSSSYDHLSLDDFADHTNPGMGRNVPPYDPNKGD